VLEAPRFTFRSSRASRAGALALLLALPAAARNVAAQPPPAAASASASASAQAAPSTSASASAAPSAPTQEDRDRANKLMDEGDEAMKRGDGAAALTAYREAHAIMRVPSTGIEVARALEKLGKLTAALAAARDVAAMPAATNEPKPFTEAREAAKALAAALEARVPTLTIVVRVAIAGTPVDASLDGRKLSKEEVAAPIALDPGNYRVSATAEGHAAAIVDVTLKERDRAQAALALARVLVIPPEPTKPPPVAPPPPPPPISPLVPAGFSIAGAGLLAGVITGALAISAANEANHLCPAGVCPDTTVKDRAQGRYGTADVLAVVSDVSFVVALGGAALGVYGLVAAPKASDPKPPSAAPSAAFSFGPTSAKLRVTF
jgi:hypothetical protein